MGILGWVGSWLFGKSAGECGDIHGDDTPEDGTINDDDQTILVPALVRQQPSFDTELEHDDQPGNKKRKANHDSIVIYDHEQGSSSASSSQPICHLDWLLSNDPGVCRINEALRCKLRSLFARAIDVSTELKHDEIQPKKKRRMEVHQWLTDVYQIRDEVQKLATDGKSIEHFTSQVDELLQRGNFPNGYVLLDDSPIEFPLLSKNPAGEKFASNTAKILEWLKNNERCIIGVYGMGGVGKTTLLRWIYNEVLKQDIFGRPYWVTVSQNCDELKLQNEIAKELGIDLSAEGDDRKRAAILHKRLSTMGPTVLFLDDMWKWNPFLGKDIDFPIEGSNCKIILSSRSRKVCNEMGCKGFIIETKVLPEDEAWNLFVDKLGHYDKLTEEVKGIARLIAKECGGLPLAIATMARSMTDVVDVCVWNDALNELRQSSCEQSDMEEYVFSVLKYSYNHLNDQRLQCCFLSCILHPEDKRIDRKTLVDEWIMEGLLDDVGSRSEQLNKGHTILNKLINSCLLEACTDFRGSECVKMHDLMRDLAIMITKEYPCFWLKSEQCLEGVPEEKLWCKDLVKVLLDRNDIKEIPNGMQPPTPELTLLRLNNNPLVRIPESFFLQMRALTVLDLSYTSIVRLPESVSDLANLRALLLARCNELTYVPSLAKLSNLRVLDLYDAVNLEKAPDGIEKLKCLEKVSYWPWDISGFNKLIQSLPSSISCYRFWLHDPKLFKTIEDVCCTFEDKYYGDFFNRGYEKEVWVAGAVIEDDETSYMLPATIEKLVIYKFDVNRRILGDVFPTLGLATDLKMLSISRCPKIKVIFPLSDKQLSLPNLKYLEVSSCDALEEIFESNINNHHNSVLALPNLVRVRLHSLPKLRRIYMNLHLCTSLEELDVSSCCELEEIFESNINNHHNSVLALPNLVRVRLHSLPKLRRIYLNLHLCTSLEELDVSHCPELEEIFDGDAGNGSSSSTSQEGAETLVIDSMSACIPQPNPVSALPKLKILKLEDLPKLGSIYKDLHLSTSLEVLQVMDCPKIERIFKAPELILALSKLKIISLERLPKLESICKDLHLCISLENLRVIKCPKIEGVAEEKLWCRDLVEVSLTSNTREIPNVMAPPTPVLARLNLKGLTGIPESFFMHMRAITVLDLSQTDIVRLPESVSDLANLRELLLAECDKLTYVPSLAKLSNLEVLDLDYAEMLEKAPDGIEKLKCLEKVSYWPWDISDITGFNKLIQSLPSSLSCYRFWLHDPKSFKTIRDVKDADEADDYDFYIDDMFKGNEKGVWVAGAVIEDDETTYMLPATIETLDIYRCDVNRRYLLGDVFPNLTDLKWLYIRYCNGLKYIWSSSSSSPLGPQQGSFIDAITLTSLPDLRGLTEFEGCSFSRLRCLYIQDCPKIKLIFPLSEKQLSLPNLFIVRLHSLPKLRRIYMNLHLCTSLEELSIESCEELVEIFESEGRSSSSSSTLLGGTETLVVHPMNACIPQPNPGSTLPKLKILELKDLPKLGSIYKDLHLCTSLEKLSVWNCNELEEIFESGSSNSSSCNSPPSPNSVLSKLRIISLGNLPKLESIYKDLHLCTSLKELEVMDCPKIERIFEAPKPILALPGLWKLKLLRLQYLRSIHKGILLCTSLKVYSVEGCLKLKKVPLSDHLICDDSPSSLLSLPSESHNPELWELLHSDYPEDARLLSDLIHSVKLEEHNQNQLKLKRKRSDLEGENS